MEKLYIALVTAITVGLGVFFFMPEKDFNKEFNIPEPSNIKLSFIEKNKANLSWKNNFIGKNVIVFLDDVEGNRIASFILEPNVNNIDIELKEGIDYKAYIRAISSQGSYADSKNIYIKFFNSQADEAIFRGEDVELKIYKKSFIEGFNTLIYSIEDGENSFIDISYFRPENLTILKSVTSQSTSNIKDVIFPFGIKHTGKEAFDFPKYMKVFYENKIYRDFAIRRNEKYYPVISKELTRDEYENIYPTFFEIFSENFLNIPVIQNMKVKLFYKDYKKVPSYAELWKQKPYQKNMTFKQDLFVIDDYITRNEVSYRMPEKLMNNASGVELKDKAVIFIHGLQFVRLDQDYNNNGDFPWRYNRRFDYFNSWFEYIYKNPEKFENFDYYEFIYDTHSMTAEEFGEQLNKIMDENGFFDENGYKEIYLIGHSMGGLVARYAANVQYRPNIEKIITINAVNKGSPFQNLPQLFYSELISNYTFSLDIVEPLYSILTKTINSIIDKKPLDISTEIETIMRKNPLLFPVLFSEYGILDTFQGGMSINYVNQEYLSALENKLYSNIPFNDSIFKINDKIKKLNDEDMYLEKTIIFLSQINQYTSKPHFNFTYSVLKAFSEVAGIEDEDMINNDGAVTLDSQMLEGYEGPTIDKTFYENTVHEDILKNKDLIKRAFEEYILK
jgi:triacylglycerol esterase/lipase EstA (alpha/beta hydrolase family)